MYKQIIHHNNHSILVLEHKVVLKWQINEKIIYLSIAEQAECNWIQDSN